MRRMVLIGCAVSALVISLLNASPAAARFFDTPPPNDKIVIDVVTVNGSGCPAGTPGAATVFVAPDNQAFTVTYSNYMAQVGVGAGPTDLRKNCQIALMVHAPQGFTYAIAQADYRGFASLARGATALQRANYYFQGQSATAFINHNFTGAMADDWQSTDVTEIGALVFAPCGALRSFNINTELRVNAGTSDPRRTTSFIAMDSTDGSITTVYHFHWATCPR
jgi:hypothetical protein